MSDRQKSGLSARTVGSLASLLLRFARQNQATSTVEFALVATPFLALTFGIIQTAIVFFAGQTMETAASVAGRLVRPVARRSNQGWSAAQFKQQVCNQIQAMLNCSGGLYIDVETYASFASARSSACAIVDGVLDSASLGYHPGAPGDVVVVRLYYQYPVYFNVLGLEQPDWRPEPARWPLPYSANGPMHRCDDERRAMAALTVRPIRLVARFMRDRRAVSSVELPPSSAG